MTMDRSTTHPSEERLAAFAGADPDATSDRELALHVPACPRCQEVVADLVALRAALAELPDLAPSRPLRLLPPVAEPRPTVAQRLAGIAHRTFAPLLAAGAGLVLVGAVGGIGSLGAPSPASAPAGATPGAGDGAAELSDETTPTPRERDDSPLSGAASPQPDLVRPGALASPRSQSGAEDQGTAAPEQVMRGPMSQSGPPWAGLFVAGAALIGVALTLRFVVAPRAG
jgi:hypothetical protein